MKKQHPPHALFWAGIDLAKATFEAALWGHEEFRAMRVRSFPRCEEGARALLAWLRENAGPDGPIGLVMEATAAFAEELATWLLDLDPGLHVAIVNPIQTSAFLRSLGLRNKTDDLDAKALAQYGAERRPIPWEKPKPEMAILKDLARVRMDLVHARAAMTLRLKDHARASKSAAKAMAKVIGALDGQIKCLEVEIRKHLRAHEVLAEQAERMDSIVGVGLLTAVTVMTELGDLRRFARSRQLTAFAGMSPRWRESGTSVHGKPRLCKQGSTRVRAVLYLAASAAVRFNPDMKAFYDRLLAQGKVRRVALGAVMRKLLVLMRAIVKAGHDWVPGALAV
jgi:transposase